MLPYINVHCGPCTYLLRSVCNAKSLTCLIWLGYISGGAGSRSSAPPVEGEALWKASELGSARNGYAVTQHDLSELKSPPATKAPEWHIRGFLKD